MCVHRTVYNCCTQYYTEQTWWFSPLPSRQSPHLRWCLSLKSSDNLPCYPPHSHHTSDDVYRPGVGSQCGHIKEDTLHWASLVLRWVTIHSQVCHLRLYSVTSHSGQLGHLPSLVQEMGTSQGALAVLCGWEGNNRCRITLAMHQRLWYIHL